MSEEGRDIPYSERQHWEHGTVDPERRKKFIKNVTAVQINIALIENQKPLWASFSLGALRFVFQ